MACLHLARSGFLPMIHPRSGFLQRHRSHALCLPVHCCLQEEVGDNGEERPESLFTKELKRRGMKDAETASYSVPGQEDMESKAENGGDRQWTKRNGVASAEYEKDATGQRERSIALNSVGIEGLVPRAKLLLTLGGHSFGILAFDLDHILCICGIVLVFWFRLCARC
ncbi:hypothetical protein HPP92_005742 [Vanilla planifolia]|uniref:Uncharacterized protein n=1 Tax=Vanilla planifolia TaxID=51239 RepID=A0A835VBI3_VANPL|nr:hypothetical protein HPP92_006035 [Vanilla planifolia]KAG0494748.1 hypothetical protein HPP92_005742 [Vanilla planifolia]